MSKEKELLEEEVDETNELDLGANLKKYENSQGAFLRYTGYEKKELTKKDMFSHDGTAYPLYTDGYNYFITREDIQHALLYPDSVQLARMRRRYPDEFDGQYLEEVICEDQVVQGAYTIIGVIKLATHTQSFRRANMFLANLKVCLLKHDLVMAELISATGELMKYADLEQKDFKGFIESVEETKEVETKESASIDKETIEKLTLSIDTLIKLLEPLSEELKKIAREIK